MRRNGAPRLYTLVWRTIIIIARRTRLRPRNIVYESSAGQLIRKRTVNNNVLEIPLSVDAVRTGRGRTFARFFRQKGTVVSAFFSPSLSQTFSPRENILTDRFLFFFSFFSVLTTRVRRMFCRDRVSNVAHKRIARRFFRPRFKKVPAR